METLWETLFVGGFDLLACQEQGPSEFSAKVRETLFLDDK